MAWQNDYENFSPVVTIIPTQDIHSTLTAIAFNSPLYFTLKKVYQNTSD